VSPPWLSEPHMQVQCDGFRRFEFVCGVHATLVADATTIRRENDDSCDEQTHVHKSGGRQPAVVRETRLRRHGAIARKTADSMWADHRCHRVQRYHGGLTPPAPGCTTFVRCEKPHLRCANAGSQERRALARRGFTKRIWKCNAMNFRVSSSYAECTPRGAYAPRSWLHDVCSLQKATFALHKRTFPRAAGVSPPWFAESHPQVQCAEFPRIELVCAVHSTGGLRQPLLVGNASARRIMGIPAANSTGTSLRSGTRPAHMRIPAADSIRSPQGAYAPALGCATFVRSEVRHSRC
jgi:hypothetical protein